MSIDADINDFSSRILLRYFRFGAPVDDISARVILDRDLEVLKGHWALSSAARELVNYVALHPHEAQSLLKFETRIDDTVARGRINARKTWLQRLQTGLSTVIVAEQPVRSFNTGPNLVLSWVLREVSSYISKLLSWQGEGSPYLESIEAIQQSLRSIQKIESLREPLRTVERRRPTAGDILNAKRSRQKIYHLAVEAYFLLQELETGNPAAIEKITRSALLAPLEDWRRFELAVGLAIGEALSSATNSALQLHLLSGESSSPIITTGRFSLFWQQRTEYYNPPILEPSEQISSDILLAYGLYIGADRPDLIVVDNELACVAAIIEVKYLSGDTAKARFKDGVNQVVRYARGYVPQAGLPSLLSRSVVALSHDAPTKVDLAAQVPLGIDFNALRQHGLSSWATQLAQRASPS